MQSVRGLRWCNFISLIVVSVAFAIFVLNAVVVVIVAGGGAAAVAAVQEAGFEIVEIWAPGTLRELAGYLLGLTAPYWTEDAIMGGASDWPLQVYMLARKPA